MTSASSLGTSLAICVAAAALEGACAGTGVKAFFATLRSPKYSAPLPVWYAIGGLYYVTFGFVVCRLLRLGDEVPFRSAAIALVVSMLVANALWNLIFFRARNLYTAYAGESVIPV